MMLSFVFGRNNILFSQTIRSIISINYQLRLFSTENPEYNANFAKELKNRLATLGVDCLKSSGPGGQNVNKRSTKVRIKFNIRECAWLSERAKQKLEQQEGNRISKEGDLVVECQKYRTQEQNHDKVLKILKNMLERANESEHNVTKQTILQLKHRKSYLQKKSRSARKHQLIAAKKKEEKYLNEKNSWESEE